MGIWVGMKPGPTGIHAHKTAQRALGRAVLGNCRRHQVLKGLTEENCARVAAVCRRALQVSEEDILGEHFSVSRFSMRPYL